LAIAAAAARQQQIPIVEAVTVTRDSAYSSL